MSKKVLTQQSEEPGETLTASANSNFQDEDILPIHFRERLIGMFGQIDKEFETLYQENALLRERVETLESAVGIVPGNLTSANRSADASAVATVNATPRGEQRMQHANEAALSRDLYGAQQSLSVSSGGGRKPGATPIAKRFMKAGASMRSKLQQHPAFGSKSGNADLSRTKVSSGSSSVSCRLLHSYTGHIDGLWEVHACATRAGLLGTASADRTAGLFDINSGVMLQQYVGHAGSVNSIRFAESPQTGDLWALTASGDQTAHLWCVNAKSLSMLNNSASNATHGGIGESDEFDGIGSSTAAQVATSSSVDFYQQQVAGTAGGVGDDLDYAGIASNKILTGSNRNFPAGSTTTTRDALRKFRSHSSVVSCADFLGGSTDFVITASWDGTACLHDVQTGEQLNCLSGHDDELTHVSSHRQLRLFATSSRDSTLRLWDFRDPIHSVSVFQGHTDVVTSTVFTPASDGNIVVSGSDDRTVKTWDLRNMRSAISVARFKSGVNRLAVNRNQVAVPLDNGQIYILDLTTGKLVRLPLLSKLKSSSSSHHQHTRQHQHQSHRVHQSQQQQHGSMSSSQNNNNTRIVTSVAWLDNNSSNSVNNNSSRPRTSSRTTQAQQNLSTVPGEPMQAGNDVIVNNESAAASAAAAAAVQAANNATPNPAAQQRPVANTVDNRDVSGSAQSVTSSVSALAMPASSSTVLPSSMSSTISECNFFSSSFERGIAYGWRLENLSGY